MTLVNYARSGAYLKGESRASAVSAQEENDATSRVTASIRYALTFLASLYSAQINVPCVSFRKMLPTTKVMAATAMG